MQADIARVTLYRNGALLVRRGRCEPGPVSVEGLPLLFSSDSLRVRSPGGEIHDVEETCQLSATPKPPPVNEDALRALAEQELRVDDHLATLASLVKAYESVKPGEPGRHPPEELPDARAWIAAHELAEDKLRALEQRRADLLQEKRRLAKERRILSRADEGDTEPPRFSRGVRFTLLAESAADVEIEYFVSAARWVPTYTLHLAGERGTLALSALVAQASGEDWRSAKLAFSTADLARETTLPELLSWRIGRAQPNRRPSFRDLPGDLEQLFAGYDRSASAPKGPPLSMAGAGFMKPRVLEEARSPMPSRARAAPLFSPADDLDEMPSAEADLSVWEETTGALEEDELDAVSSFAAPAPMAAMAKRSMSASGGGAPGAAPSSRVQRSTPEPLPPRLRHAYLRLQGADEPERGTLRPVDPTHHLWDLVEDHEAASFEDLQRAVWALREAAARVESMPAPTGTSYLPADSFHHVYRASSEHDVPCDGSYHRVLVERREADAQLDFRVVPREAPEIYRYCALQAPQGAPLLPGPLHVYDDGAFRVTSRIDGTGGGERLELNLGVEPALRVLGRTVQVEQQEKGLVSQRSRVSHEVTVQLRSGLPVPATVLLFDRLPVPGDNEKDLEVTLEHSEPVAERDDKDPRGQPLEGGLRFRITVPPGERAKVLYTYVISLPAKAEVMGGNRRE